METCNNRRHEQIVYEGGACPLCEAIDQIEELKKEKENLQYELENKE
jgi:hypothetical protein